MKAYHIFFLILKVALLIQFTLVLAKKQEIDSKIYIITEIIFKTTIGIFIEIFLFHRMIEGIDVEDKIIISFAGGLLVYDAFVNDLPLLLKKFDVKVSF